MMRLFYFTLIFLLSSHVAEAAEPVLKSTQLDQESVEVTVYNHDLGLIKEIRAISIPAGEGSLQYEDVASAIIPTSVHISPLNEDSGFSVLEQNYEYDLISEEKLLDRYVGKTVKLLKENEYHDRKEIVTAKLLSNNGRPIYEIDNEIYLGQAGLPILPEIPENLMATPTLVWQYTNNRPETTRMEVNYLTRQISWEADYVLILNAKDSEAALSGWISLQNQSGASYTNATLKLIAGDVNQVTPQNFRQDQYLMAEAASFAKAAPAFEEQAFFEYHIYDLTRKTTIKNNQTKQISLLEATHVATRKEYVTNSENSYFYMQPYGEEKQKQAVSVYVLFQNTKENELGIPLPKGVARIYKADDSGSLQFIGEDHLEHTPKDEEVKLRLGEAFDITARRTQTSFRQITAHLFESNWEILLKNHKEESVTVLLEETLPQSWEVLEHSHPYEKISAAKIRFEVTLKQDEEVKVAYRIQAGY